MSFCNNLGFLHFYSFLHVENVIYSFLRKLHGNAKNHVELPTQVVS